jgi:hypothetical protein
MLFRLKREKGIPSVEIEVGSSKSEEYDEVSAYDET